MVLGKKLTAAHFCCSGMGTKVEYSIDVLATSVVDSNNVAVKGVDVWEQHQNKRVSYKDCHRIGTTNYSLEFPMERRKLDRHNVESIKKTMQVHEDIFRHQVSSSSSSSCIVRGSVKCLN